MITVARVASAEVFKLRSVRSYRWSLATAAIGVVVAAAVMAGLAGPDRTAAAPDSVALPLEYFAYAMMIIGVLSVTSDIACGTAAITQALVPWRTRLLAGRYLATGTLAVVAALVVGPAVLVADWLGSGAGPGAAFVADTLAVIVTGLSAIVLATVLGVAFGILVRSTAAAVSILLLWSFVVETILVFVIPARWGAFLPFKTIGGSRLLMDELSAGAGLAVFALFTAAMVALAFVVSARRDAATG